MNKKNNEIWKSLSTNAEHLNFVLKEILEIKKELLKLKNKEIN